MKQLLLLIVFIIFLGACSGNESTKSSPNNKPPEIVYINQTNNNSALPNQNQTNVQPANVNSANKKDLKTATLAALPAPDDSTFTSTMDKKGNFMEVRVFNSHPQLVKVEKKFIGKNISYKVYLKNGKVVDAPVDKMENFRALAPNNILEAIGLRPTPTSADQNMPNPKKEQEK